MFQPHISVSDYDNLSMDNQGWFSYMQPENKSIPHSCPPNNKNLTGQWNMGWEEAKEDITNLPAEDVMLFLS